MLNYSKISKIHHIKYSIKYFYNKNRFYIICLSFIILLCLLTGLFTALKITDMEKAMKVCEFSFESISEGKIYDFSYFIKRYLSILLMIGLLFLFSLNKWTCIFGYILLGYRAFLITLNCVLLIKYIGISGVINSVLIILPCQLLQLIIMSLIFVFLCANTREKKQCGRADENYIKYIFALLVASMILNIIEFILLFIFKATTILIL